MRETKLLSQFPYSIPSREEILGILRTSSGAQNAAALAAALGVKPEEMDGPTRRLNAMERDGQVLRVAVHVPPRLPVDVDPVGVKPALLAPERVAAGNHYHHSAIEGTVIQVDSLVSIQVKNEERCERRLLTKQGELVFMQQWTPGAVFRDMLHQWHLRNVTFVQLIAEELAAIRRPDCNRGQVHTIATWARWHSARRWV